MSISVHDLRVSLRDKVKRIEDLERQIVELREEIQKRDVRLKESDVELTRREEMIAMKDLIIKEKDIYILKLEAEIMSLTLEKELRENESQQHQQQQAQRRHGSQSTNCVTRNDSINSNGIATNTTSTTNSNCVAATNHSLKYSNEQSMEVNNNKEQLRSSYINNLKSKRIAISAESAQSRFNNVKNSKDVLKEHEKDEETEEFLKNAIYENDFLKNLEIDQIDNIVACMYPVDFDEGALIIREGDIGNILYVVDEGIVEVTKNQRLVCTMSSGKLFGELAILYNCTRTASIRALTNCKLWAIDRSTFQAIMMRFGIEKHDEYMELLKNIPIFQDIREDLFTKLIDMFDECTYNNNSHIVRQFAKGDTFYIISKGRVKLTKSNSKWDEPKFLRYMERGDFFGESALIEEETRQFNVMVDDPNGVTCLVLDRQAYNQIFNDPEMKIKRTESIKMYKRAQTQLLNLDNQNEEEHDLDGIRLCEFEIIGTLGVGGFGRVELVRNSRDARTYALKILKKQHVVETKQQDHILNERNIMFDARTNFVCRLYKTFKDKKYLYLLLEVCLGGELWSLLRERGQFEENHTKFYTACVIEALGYLHSKGIVYRDLKPENLLLDSRGYCKLVDFGFAKKVGLGKKTWTFCGTPEYVAPEIILNKGHDIGVDYWSLGVLIFELLTGDPPFVGSDPMSTYNSILKGIDAIDFPRKIPKVCSALIKRLCRENAVDRLGYQRGGIRDIQKHKWFEGFSWENLRNGSLEAPYIPRLKDNTDLINFDSYPEDNGPAPEDDLTGWDAHF